MQFTRILGAVIPQVFDSMRYGNGIKTIFLLLAFMALARLKSI